MASGFRVKVTGVDSVAKGLERMNPGLNTKIVVDSLIESISLVLRTAAQEKIVRGGARNSPPRAGILTSRTGRLRASLSLQGGGIDKSGLPNKISGGSNVKYAGVHEFGLGRHPKRPYLKPALDQDSPKFPAIFSKHWNKALP